MGQVTWTSEAERWLRRIHDHIAEDSPVAAQRVTTAIYRRAEVLADFPEIGYLYHRKAEQPVRILLYGHYRIAYAILPSRDVDVLGVYHGALDIVRFLGEMDR